MCPSCPDWPDVAAAIGPGYQWDGFTAFWYNQPWLFPGVHDAIASSSTVAEEPVVDRLLSLRQPGELATSPDGSRVVFRVAEAVRERSAARTAACGPDPSRARLRR